MRVLDDLNTFYGACTFLIDEVAILNDFVLLIFVF